ncbi:MAG: 1-acyl-sn-glycerol-3-phosphate acyltransferase [Lentisphaeria bacterium]|nr:1-acyl-sn-glycerol-3-phosphate acyltransferase [Lentisphaeria bacterium]
MELMLFLRRIAKIVLLLLWSLLLMLPAALSLCFLHYWPRVRRGAEWARVWTRGAAWITGVNVVRHGELPAASGCLLVSNHLGYLDVLAHGSLFPIRFAPKAEIRHWFFFGPLVALGMPVWIDRKSPRKAERYAAEFRETLAHGVPLLVYPEGTSSDGKHGLLPFKSTPFAALPEDGRILPMVGFYRETPADSAPGAWFGDVPFPAHVWGVLGLREIRIDVFVLPEMRPLPGEGRKELAQRVRTAMMEEYDRHEGLV